MYFDGGQWILVGTLLGMGYDCWSDKVKLFEGSDNGVWNGVSPQVTFIHRIMRKYGEKTLDFIFYSSYMHFKNTFKAQWQFQCVFQSTPKRRQP